MSIRQHRIDSPQKIREKIAAFKGKKITLVLANNTSVLGELREVLPESVVIINGRLKKTEFHFSDIKELYFDEIV